MEPYPDHRSPTAARFYGIYFFEKAAKTKLRLPFKSTAAQSEKDRN
jgi:hypothetical protein